MGPYWKSACNQICQQICINSIIIVFYGQGIRSETEFCVNDVKSIHSLAKTVEAGTILFEEGTPGGGMIILLSGRLSVTVRGQEVAIISEPGAYVGETSVLTGNTRSATVTATSSTTIIRLSKKQASVFLQAEAAEGKVVENLSKRLSRTNDTLTENLSKLDDVSRGLYDLLDALKNLYRQMDAAEASSESYHEAMRVLRRLINEYGSAKLTDKDVSV